MNLNPDNSNPMQMSLTLSTQDVDEWWFFLHSPNIRTSPITKSYGGNFIRHNVMDGKLEGAQYEYDVYRLETHVIDQDNHPCVDFEPVDFDKCIDDYVSSKINCSLPWIKKNASGVLPYCSQPEEYGHFWDLSLLILSSSEKDISSRTGCKPSCTRMEYASKHVYTQKRYLLKEKTMTVNLEYASNRFMTREQYYTYDYPDLIADFGGFLGLLLGHSILSLYDNVLYLFSKLKLSYHHRVCGNT